MLPKIGKNITIAMFITILITSTIPYQVKAQQNNYNYTPYYTANNSYVSDNPNLRLQQFSMSAWFKTNMTNNKVVAIIVNKGGFGSDGSSIPDMNYGIWLTGTNQGVAGKVEDSSPLLLKNISFEKVIPDQGDNGKTLDPVLWHVVEGKTEVQLM